MIPAISNIALSPFDHARELDAVAAIGYRGLEVAPSRVWRDTWRGLGNADVAAYRRDIESAGLAVVGLHSLVYDHPNLQLFGGPEVRAETLSFMVHLSGVCRDLGGHTLIWGGGRKRGEVPADAALDIAVDFMSELCQRIKDHGTCFCFEILGPSDSDFVNSAGEAAEIVRRVGHQALRLHLDTKAMVENDEVRAEIFATMAADLVHVHANDAGLGVLGASGKVDHARIGKLLEEIDYDGYVTVEQRMHDVDSPLDAARQSFRTLETCYLARGRAA